MQGKKSLFILYAVATFFAIGPSLSGPLGRLEIISPQAKVPTLQGKGLWHAVLSGHRNHGRWRPRHD